MDSNETNKKTKIQLEIERNPEMDKLTERKISEEQLQKIISPAIGPVIKNMNSIIQKNQVPVISFVHILCYKQETIDRQHVLRHHDKLGHIN